jgi:peptide/nickel transport system substrate-binding protein
MSGPLASAEDIIRIAQPQRTLTLDPIASTSGGSIETFGQLYSRLLRRDENGELQPGLAERWEISPDGAEYTFHLRQARFSNGSPITADDVVFTLLRMRDDPAASYSLSVASVKMARALDEHTVLVTLNAPNAPFLDAMEICFLGIVSKSDVERRGSQAAFAEQPVTSGPYRVVRWNRGDRVVLEANPFYWRESYPRNSGAELIEVPDVNTRLAMLLAGEVDAVRDILWSQAAQLAASGLARVPDQPSTLIRVVGLNHGRPPFDDVRVRQAAVLALDRGLITEVYSRGRATVANTTMPAALLYHDDDHPGWPYDPGQARQLLEEAGAIGAEVELYIQAPDVALDFLAVVLQAYWSAVGLNVRIEKADQALGILLWQDGNYDAWIDSWYNENLDPDLASRWAVCGTCGSHAFNTFYQNDEVDRLVTEGAQTLDPAKRRDIYHRIQQISTREVAQIPIANEPWQNAYSHDIEGLEYTPAMQWTLEDTRHVR